MMTATSHRGCILAALLRDGTVEDVVGRTSLPSDVVARELCRLCELGIAAGRPTAEGTIYRLRTAGATLADADVAERALRDLRDKRARAA